MYVLGALLRQLGHILELQQSAAQPIKAHLNNVLLQKHVLTECLGVTSFTCKPKATWLPVLEKEGSERKRARMETNPEFYNKQIQLKEK